MPSIETQNDEVVLFIKTDEGYMVVDSIDDEFGTVYARWAGQDRSYAESFDYDELGDKGPDEPPSYWIYLIQDKKWVEFICKEKGNKGYVRYHDPDLGHHRSVHLFYLVNTGHKWI